MQLVQVISVMLAVGTALGELPQRQHYISIEDPSTTSGKKELRSKLIRPNIGC
jgi:hypothetical protein